MVSPVCILLLLLVTLTAVVKHQVVIKPCWMLLIYKMHVDVHNMRWPNLNSWVLIPHQELLGELETFVVRVPYVNWD